MADYYYYSKTSTIVFKDEDGKCFSSNNNGVDWVELFLDLGVGKIRSIYKDPYRGSRIFFVPFDKPKLVYSDDNGENYLSVDVPSPANTVGAPILMTHPGDKNYLLWTGEVSCKGQDLACHTEVYFSTDYGVTWTSLNSYVRQCQFGQTDKFVAPVKDSIFCLGFGITHLILTVCRSAGRRSAIFGHF